MHCKTNLKFNLLICFVFKIQWENSVGNRLKMQSCSQREMYPKTTRSSSLHKDSELAISNHSAARDPAFATHNQQDSPPTLTPSRPLQFPRFQRHYDLMTRHKTRKITSYRERVKTHKIPICTGCAGATAVVGFISNRMERESRC